MAVAGSSVTTNPKRLVPMSGSYFQNIIMFKITPLRVLEESIFTIFHSSSFLEKTEECLRGRQDIRYKAVYPWSVKPEAR